MTKRALITGITGQDGSYLAELLLDKGYEVSGLIRRTTTVSYERIKHIQILQRSGRLDADLRWCAVQSQTDSASDVSSFNVKVADGK